MESRRQARFSKLLQQELGDIFLREGKTAFGNEFITVSQVRVSPDLRQAKIYLSFLNEKEPEKRLKLIRNHGGDIRYHLGNRIKNQVRHIPELHFYYDDTMDYVEKMDRIFEDLHKKDDDKEDKG